MQAHGNFENFILAMIILSSLKLVVDTYIDTNSDNETNKFLSSLSTNMDYAFNIIFTLESLVKIIALGFFFDNGSYLRDS